MKDTDGSKSPYYLISTWDLEPIPASVAAKEREEILRKGSLLSEKGKSFTPEQTRALAPMPWCEELIVVIFWGLMFAALFVGWLILGILLYVKPKLGVAVCAVLAGFSFWTNKFSPVAFRSYLATLNLKYFSFRTIWKRTIPPGTYISVQPPHGLFPFGGVLGLFAMPRFVGFHARGAAASFILRFPIAGNLLRACGGIDASRNNLRRHLERGDFVGVSSGGIAEIFETNSADGTEVIVLKSRGGICKLALQYGIPIIPSYLFGNNDAFHVMYDNGGIMKSIARKLQIPLVGFYGRWGLPIPFRAPLLCVVGDVIPVEKVENPTKEQIQKLLDKVEASIVALFDEHKAAYGWGNVKMIVR
jgi:1-acyl-sn-glycerol-3-phosphate acyltransferase